MTAIPPPAERMQILLDLTSPIDVVDDDGNVIGKGPPLVTFTPEQILELLEAP